MDSEAREDLIVILAGLLGIVLGYALRRSRRHGTVADDRFGAVGTSSLVATPSLARIAGDALNVDRADVGKQALLSLAVGTLLTTFADEAARLLPTADAARRSKE